MTPAERWLLPEGIEELLPPEAARLERLRRRLLDLYRAWGYQQVFPPLVEYLDSLLTGMGRDLALQTFTLTDPLTGRQMGVRADMTPQIARLDAHTLNAEGTCRLCYAGHVLHARPASLTASRALIQMGAELYGHSGAESDAEVVLLMLETLRIAGLEGIHLDLGHVDIYRALADEAGLQGETEWRLFDILQRKSIPELEQFLAREVSDGTARRRLRDLADLAGDVTLLDRARSVLAGAGDRVFAAIDTLQAVAERVRTRTAGVTLYFDLGELRGYHYHTGLVFSAYMPGVGHSIASGGRYDHVGEVFGRARPATGFSTDLAQLIKWGRDESDAPRRILAPLLDDPSLWQKIHALREAGEVIIQSLPGETPTPAHEFRLEPSADPAGWHVVPAS